MDISLYGFCLWVVAIKHLIDASRDQKAGLYAVRVSFAIHRGNTISLLGTLSSDVDAKEFYNDIYLYRYLPQLLF